MHFQFLQFDPISILAPTFSFHHFQSLNQLTCVIFVISVSQHMEISDVADGGIKISLKIHHGTYHPCHMGFLPLYFTRDHHYHINPPNQYQKPKISQISTRNPKFPKFELRAPPTRLSLISPNHDKKYFRSPKLELKQALQQVLA